MFSLLIILANILVVSALNTSLNFKYAHVKYEETNEVQILSINEGTLNYIIIKEQDDDKEGIFRIGIRQKYDSYCKNKCKIFTKPLKNTGVIAREVIRYIELFNNDGKNSLIKYYNGDDITTGCVKDNTKKLLPSDNLSTVPLDGLFYTDSTSSFNYVQNFNDVAIRFGALEEKNPLARAEWIKFVSVFYGHEKEATQLFNQIEENYNCNKLLVKNNQHLLTRIRAIWLSKTSGQDLWVMNDSLYKTELLRDAGADVLTIRENSVNNLHKALKNAHFVIDDTESNNENYSIDDFYKNFGFKDDGSRNKQNFIIKKNILRNDGARSSNNISSWREDYLVYPHLALVDLIYWFHPKLPVSEFFNFEIKNGEYDHHYWFRNIAVESPIHMTSNLKCPTKLPDILTQKVCINVDGFYSDYGDYAFFDNKSTVVKNYIKLYWYFIFFAMFVMGGITSAIYLFIKGKFPKRFRGFSHKKDLESAYAMEEINGHQFYKLEDDEY